MSANSLETLYQFLVDEESHGLRLDKFLAQAVGADHSRERLQKLIHEAHVCVNGKPVTKPSTSVKENDRITCHIPDAKPIALLPQPIALEIVFEDEHMLVVNKPVGMLTHPTGREQTGTLVNALLAHCMDFKTGKSTLSGINGLIRPGIVHRLDRDTSGLLMVAKTDQAHQALSEQLKAKTARRDYVAIVQGGQMGFKTQSGTVSAPIGRNSKHREKMAVVPDGRPAVTHWTLQEQIETKFARVSLALETGRTHQIRVHMAHIGHPLVGDPLYGSGLEKTLRLKEKAGVTGQLLQAVALGFEHPQSKTPLRFEIPVSQLIQNTWAYLQIL